MNVNGLLLAASARFGHVWEALLLTLGLPGVKGNQTLNTLANVSRICFTCNRRSHRRWAPQMLLVSGHRTMWVPFQWPSTLDAITTMGAPMRRT